jgi:hypothetical protein
LLVCLFCFESHEQFFSNLATVTITVDRAANLDLCLAVTALAVRVRLRATLTATRDLRFYGHIRKTHECCALGEGVITAYFEPI